MRGPDLPNEQRGALPRGELARLAPLRRDLEASAVKGDWVKITYNGVTGWVSRSVLE